MPYYDRPRNANQVEKAIEIMEREKEGWNYGGMSNSDCDTVLNCLYRLKKLLDKGRES